VVEGWAFGVRTTLHMSSWLSIPGDLVGSSMGNRTARHAHASNIHTRSVADVMDMVQVSQRHEQSMSLDTNVHQSTHQLHDTSGNKATQIISHTRFHSPEVYIAKVPTSTRGTNGLEMLLHRQ
jgi:hypothetical protein